MKTKQVNKYHIAALLSESVDGLNIRPDGTYVDATFGGGGHSLAILSKLKNGHLIAFDRDADATPNIPDDERFTFVNHDFIYLKNHLRYLDAIPIHGLIADLGVSFHQFDTAERGFSYRFDAELDMRMDPDIRTTAKHILNEYPENELHKLFGMYGEVRNARTLAAEIVKQRNKKPIEKSTQLLDVIEKCRHRKDDPKKYAGLVFQALRITVNDELEALKNMLKQAYEVLDLHGRLSIITYHSLEDRLVKNFLKKGVELPIDEKEKELYGKTKEAFKLINKKPIIPSEEEINHNPRARSAKLRIAEKIN